MSGGGLRVRADALLCAALERSGNDRREFVAERCRDDRGLRQAVEELLDAAERAESFLERPIERCLDLPWGEVFDGGDAGPDEAPFDRSGERVGPYRLIRRIGRGGMASVYLAERVDGQWRQEVALKVIRRGVDTEDVVRRFLAERQILSSLNHPNIARLLDGGTTADGVPYLVMEYVAGTTIVRHCDENRLPVRARLQLFCEAGRAVQHAHRRLVVHRDLKPSNILVDDEGRIKLLDFGIAKLLAAPVEEGLTLTGVRPLTPSWASPEQARGEPITTASDVYQLGLLLCELLVGRPPYETRVISPALMEQAITEVEPARPSRLVTNEEAARRDTNARGLVARLRGDLDTIVLEALRKEPEDRYGSVESMVEDVERHLAGQPVRARADTVGYRARKFVARNRMGVGAAAAFVLLLSASSLITALQANRLARERDRALAEEARAERVTDFLTDLFRAADPNEVGGEDVSALELLDAGVARALQELTADPTAQADVLGAIGEMYIRRGMPSRAISVLEETVRLRRGVGGDPVGLVRDLRRLAQALWGSDPDRAIALLEEAASRAERDLGPEDPVLAAVLTDLAEHVMRFPSKSARERARALIDRALDILRQQKGDVRPALADALHASAFVYDQRRGEAIARFEQALALRRSLYGEDHTQVAAILNDMALMLEASDPAAADTLLERAIEINARIHGLEHPQTLTMMNNLAGRRRDSGDHAGAERLYREVLSRRRAASPGNSMAQAYTLHGLGWSLTELGRPEEAELHLRESLDRIESQGLGPDHPLYQMARSTLGRSLSEQGRYSEAEPLLLESYEWIAANAPLPAFMPFMLDRVVALYEDLGRAADAAEYRERRREWDRRATEE